MMEMMALKILSPSDQVASHLREQLLAGRWGVELPGTPALAQELDVDRKTIMSALKILEGEGLIKPQGVGKPRLITVPERRKSNALKIRILPYDHDDGQRPFILNLIRELEKNGHSVIVSSKTLPDLRMDVGRVSRYMKKEPADLWIPLAASRELLEWLAAEDMPVFALFGRRRDIPVGSIGPNKEAALLEAVRRLIALGHRRISYFCRMERRTPHPGYIERCYLQELEAHGIATSQFNLPNWDDTPESFHACIDKLFQHTPPTAMIFDESPFLIAFSHRLTQLGLSTPDDVSMICQDYSTAFDWCKPRVSHIHWPSAPLVMQAVEWINQFSRGTHRREAIFTEAHFVEGETIGPAPK